MPPTVAAARMTISGLAFATHWRTGSWSRRSSSARSTVTGSTFSPARARLIARPNMPPWPAIQMRRFAEVAANRLLSMSDASNPPAHFHRNQIACHHFRHELRKRHLVLPAKFSKRLSGIPLKEIDLRRSEITRVDLDERA